MLTTEPRGKDMCTKVGLRVSRSRTIRANLVDRAEDWRWGALFRWLAQPEPNPRLISAWPIARLPNWVTRVNEPLSDIEVDAVRWSVKRGSPFGSKTWMESTARRLDLESTLRPRGRPRVRPIPNNDSLVSSLGIEFEANRLGFKTETDASKRLVDRMILGSLKPCVSWIARCSF